MLLLKFIWIKKTLNKLKKFKELKDQAIINDKDFEEKKRNYKI